MDVGTWEGIFTRRRRLPWCFKDFDYLLTYSWADLPLRVRLMCPQHPPLLPEISCRTLTSGASTAFGVEPNFNPFRVAIASHD